jgi:hypothetical protein
MSSLFIVLFLLSVAGLIIGLIKPAWLRMPSRKRAALATGGAAVLFFVLFGITAPPQPAKPAETPSATVATDEQKPEQQPAPQVQQEAAQPAPQQQAAPAQPTDAQAQKDLDDFMALAKQADVVSSYDFTNDSVVYVDSNWYSMTVTQKKDFIAKIGMLKKAVTGYSHFELHDAYSDEKVGEITSFSQSVEVYK